MGLFWELFQESQIGKRKTESGDLAERVAELEQRVGDLEDFVSQLASELDRLEGVADTDLPPQPAA